MSICKDKLFFVGENLSGSLRYLFSGFSKQLSKRQGGKVVCFFFLYQRRELTF